MYRGQKNQCYKVSKHSNDSMKFMHCTYCSLECREFHYLFTVMLCIFSAFLCIFYHTNAHVHHAIPILLIQPPLCRTAILIHLITYYYFFCIQLHMRSVVHRLWSKSSYCIFYSISHVLTRARAPTFVFSVNKSHFIFLKVLR